MGVGVRVGDEVSFSGGHFVEPNLVPRALLDLVVGERFGTQSTTSGTPYRARTTSGTPYQDPGDWGEVQCQDPKVQCQDPGDW